MLRTRTDARLSPSNNPYNAPPQSITARSRTQAETVLRDLAYVLQLTRTVRESLRETVAS